jgi:hypothetical protein
MSGSVLAITIFKDISSKRRLERVSKPERKSHLFWRKIKKKDQNQKRQYP